MDKVKNLAFLRRKGINRDQYELRNNLLSAIAQGQFAVVITFFFFLPSAPNIYMFDWMLPSTNLASKS